MNPVRPLLGRPGEPCSGCGAALAGDQRYCLECGSRRGDPRVAYLELLWPAPPAMVALPPAPAAVPAARPARGRRLPRPQLVAGSTVALVGTGMIMGAALGSLAPSSIAGAPRQQINVALATPAVVPPKPASPEPPPPPAVPPAGDAPVEPADVADPAPEAPDAAALQAPDAEEITPGETADQTAGTGGEDGDDKPAPPEQLAGAVVHVNERADSFTLAAPDGELTAVHAARLPELGDEVRVKAQLLGNGTYAGARPDKRGRATDAAVSGVVSWSDPALRVYAVSARGVSMLVAAPPADPALPPPPPPPAPGILVDVTVAFAAPPAGQKGPDLAQQALTERGPAKDPVELSGLVQAADEATRLVTISADDQGLSGVLLPVRVPDTFDLKAFRPGRPVTFSATVEPDGSFLALGAGRDDGRKGAADEESLQGTHIKPPGSDEAGGSGQEQDSGSSDNTKATSRR